MCRKKIVIPENNTYQPLTIWMNDTLNLSIVSIMITDFQDKFPFWHFLPVWPWPVTWYLNFPIYKIGAAANSSSLGFYNIKKVNK